MDTDVPLSGELLLTMNICAFIGVIILSTTTGILKAGTTEHCVEPSESGSCRYCERGWFGNDCNDQCQNCNIGGCNQTTGICQQCSPGYYSINCSIACPLQCRESYGNTLCDRERGRCSDGCKPTWWGSRCENNCSNHCRNSICLYSDGSCHLGCEDGLYGIFCYKSCSTGCGNNTCYSNGTCLNHCNVGYYGPACDGNCTDQCIDRDCVLESDSDLPLCTKGCVRGWQPPYCKVSCKPKCTTCNDSGECLSCEGGYWGAFCQYQCSRNCVNNSCNSDGSCAGCRDGWYGTHCDTPCPVRQCRSCCQNNGTCRRCRAGDLDDAGQCVSAKSSWITVICITTASILVIVAVFMILFWKYRRTCRTRIEQLGRREDQNAHIEQEQLQTVM
ncbi:scavenger receptor class F member 1-like isoform X2 [Haliotis rufescens]|uniref:scavenger receptor class F member 1-like isoform X2 n=1 Tax=Haliotis rufescens TaxID=6454 RepID=UPI00201F8BC6|nr:scavenger receptor class F member 1-like isoform X2 [Haliotis rufescens]